MTDRRTRDIEKLAAEFGLVVSQAKRSAHFPLRDPQTRRLIAVCAGSPSCRRYLENIRRDIRRALSLTNGDTSK